LQQALQKGLAKRIGRHHRPRNHCPLPLPKSSRPG
jgi:hypothetical protein